MLLQEEVLNWLNNNDFKIGENNPLVQPEYRSCFYDDSFTSNIGFWKDVQKFRSKNTIKKLYDTYNCNYNHVLRRQ